LGQTRELRTGDIYWLDDCPPLEGDFAKRRPVIVVSPPDRVKGEIIVLVVATSTTVLASETDRIALPNLQDEPQTKSRLPKRCWAVPRWYLAVRRETLRDYIGYVPAALQKRIVDAVLKRMAKE
jgi:mRNA-degrading endonuclease toxin of MazEF toxin-antitoxin module